MPIKRGFESIWATVLLSVCKHEIGKYVFEWTKLFIQSFDAMLI